MRNKKYFQSGLLLRQSLNFKAYKRYITAIFTYLVLKVYKKINLRCSFKATDGAAEKGKVICVARQSYPRGNSCDGLENEMKFTSPLGEIVRQKQLRIVTKAVRYKFIFHYHQFPHGA